MLLLTRIAPLLSDIVAVVFTWIKTFGHVREARRLTINVPLSTCIFRDGMFPPFYLIFYQCLICRRNHIFHVRIRRQITRVALSDFF